MDLAEREIAVRRLWPARAWARVGRRADGRAPLWIELAIIAWLFWLYDVINNFAPLRQALALRNATHLFSFERSLGLDPELTLNHWLAPHALLATVASDYYFFAHAVVTLALLALLWWTAPALYARLRTSLVAINLIAFVVFWRYPLAPPRSFPGLGFIDVVARSEAVVSWHSAALVHDADQFAAMPSLHVAWAIWCTIAIWSVSRRPLVRALAIAYPLLTSFVVLATGNHYLLDVFAGAATAGLALALERGARRLVAYRRAVVAGAVRADEPLAAHDARPAHEPLATHDPAAVRSVPAQS